MAPGYGAGDKLGAMPRRLSQRPASQMRSSTAVSGSGTLLVPTTFSVNRTVPPVPIFDRKLTGPVYRLKAVIGAWAADNLLTQPLHLDLGGLRQHIDSVASLNNDAVSRSFSLCVAARAPSRQCGVLARLGGVRNGSCRRANCTVGTMTMLRREQALACCIRVSGAGAATVSNAEVPMARPACVARDTALATVVKTIRQLGLAETLNCARGRRLNSASAVSAVRGYYGLNCGCEAAPDEILRKERRIPRPTRSQRDDSPVTVATVNGETGPTAMRHLDNVGGVRALSTARWKTCRIMQFDDERLRRMRLRRMCL